REKLHTQAAAARDLALRRATVASRSTALIVIGVGLLAIVLALVVFRSIAVPLRSLNKAMAAMIEGRDDVAVPPLGSDELGRMAETLALLKASNAERER